MMRHGVLVNEDTTIENDMVCVLEEFIAYCEHFHPVMSAAPYQLRGLHGRVLELLARLKGGEEQ